MRQSVRTVSRAVAPIAAAVAVSAVCGAQAQALVDRVDSQPPFLRTISTNGNVNVQFPDQSIQVELNIADDLSGVRTYTIDFVSPSGNQHISRTKLVAAPAVHVTPSLTLGALPNSDPDFTVFDQPGTWQAVSLIVEDVAHNKREYNASQLASLGSTTFFLTNNGGYDIVAPTLASGTINTPIISRSRPPKGTNQPPFVSAGLSITDAGNGRISGTWSASFRFCHVDGGNNCDDDLVLQGESLRRGLQANTLSVGTQMRANQTLGQYVIYSLDVDDIAGNSRHYLSTAFGGSTNFANYFPTGATIFINQ